MGALTYTYLHVGLHKDNKREDTVNKENVFSAATLKVAINYFEAPTTTYRDCPLTLPFLIFTTVCLNL